MALPDTTYELPFNITRASHVELLVADLERSLRFYVEVIGLAITERDDGAVYLRGMEESCHHSLVLRVAAHASQCVRIAFRVFTDEQLERLAEHLANLGLEPVWADLPHPGPHAARSRPRRGAARVLRAHARPTAVADALSPHRGGGALRLDHFQLHVPEVRPLCAFYTGIGFRISEYVTLDGETAGARSFLQRKGNPHDIVLFAGPPVRAFITWPSRSRTRSTLLRACDVAGELGYGSQVERGPGRHRSGRHALTLHARPRRPPRGAVHDPLPDPRHRRRAGALGPARAAASACPGASPPSARGTWRPHRWWA